jgi:hypothetical protein
MKYTGNTNALPLLKFPKCLPQKLHLPEYTKIALKICRSINCTALGHSLHEIIPFDAIKGIQTYLEFNN